MRGATVFAQTGAGVQLTGVRRAFETGVVAIESLDLTISPGDFVSILGPSGCGKSTLLRIIARLDNPDAGTIAFSENAENKIAPSNSSRVAYVFQDAHLLPWRNVLRNVCLPLELAGVSRAERKDRAMAALQRVGLVEFANQYPAQLSGGMRMRVSLARALTTEPTLLLLDEPFAALDEITRQGLDDQLRALWRANGMTVIFVTHSISEAAYLAERVVVFSARPGRIVLDHKSGLPSDRTVMIRGDAAFANETRALLTALAGAPNEVPS